MKRVGLTFAALCCWCANAAAPHTAEFQAKIDAASQAGGGRVVVPAGEWTVGTLWPNRLIGDARLPVSERKTETAWPHWKAEDKPLASGLHGPARLVVRRTAVESR